jgi:hypothetical protein
MWKLPALQTGSRPGGGKYTAEPAYNDMGLYDISYIASDIVVPINFSLLIITLHYSVIKTPAYKDTKYSIPFMTL